MYIEFFPKKQCETNIANDLTAVKKIYLDLFKRQERQNLTYTDTYDFIILIIILWL